MRCSFCVPAFRATSPSPILSWQRAPSESLIADFLARDFRTILLCRCSQQADGDILFEGEAEFYEGFLGEDGLPLPVGDSDSADDALQPLGCGLGLVRS